MTVGAVMISAIWVTARNIAVKQEFASKAYETVPMKSI
jgi:hypothetical protein